MLPVGTCDTGPDSKRHLPWSHPRQGWKREEGPPAHPPEPAYPCCPGGVGGINAVRGVSAQSSGRASDDDRGPRRLATLTIDDDAQLLRAPPGGPVSLPRR